MNIDVVDVRLDERKLPYLVSETVAEYRGEYVGEQRIVTSRYFYICSGKHHGTDHLQRCYENDIHAGMRADTSENQSEGQQTAEEIYQGWHDSPGHHDNYMNPNYTYSAH